MAAAEITGACRCGKTTFKCADVQVFSGLCHCLNCRQNNGSPVLQVIGVPATSWSVTQNADKLVKHSSSERLQVLSCGLCGGPIANCPVGVPFIGTFPTLYDQYRVKQPVLADRHKPAMHVNYENRLFDWHDSLPKFMDFPSGAGGSGRLFEQKIKIKKVRYL